jgi:hypothetical protein
LIGTCCGDCLTEFAFKIGAEGGKHVAFQGYAGGHGVAAAFEQKPLGNRAAHRLAEIDARDRAA